MSWFRAAARVLAGLLLMSFAALGASSWVAHEDDCHDDCILGVLPHEPSQHAFGAPSALPDHPLHCVVCHWMRMHRPAASVRHQVAPPVERHERAAAARDSSPLLFPAAQPPLRSPPPAPLAVV